MKFQKVIPKVAWTKEQTEERIAFVNEEIIILNKTINGINDKLSAFIEERLIIQRKIGNKQKYINQLKQQLEDITNE